jgi:hypothetical protein
MPQRATIEPQTCMSKPPSRKCLLRDSPTGGCCRANLHESTSRRVLSRATVATARDCQPIARIWPPGRLVERPGTQPVSLARFAACPLQPPASGSSLPRGLALSGSPITAKRQCQRSSSWPEKHRSFSLQRRDWQSLRAAGCGRKSFSSDFENCNEMVKIKVKSIRIPVAK